MKTKPIVLMLICLLALAECFAGCGSTPANQVAVILADTNYYQRQGNEYIKKSQGLKKSQKVLVTWKTGFIYDNGGREVLVSCLLPSANGDFIGGQEIYVPKRNIDFTTPVSADIAPLLKPSQPLPGKKFIEIGQLSEIGFKPFASAEEVKKVSASFGPMQIPMEVVARETGFIGRVNVSFAGQKNLAIKLGEGN